MTSSHPPKHIELLLEGLGAKDSSVVVSPRGPIAAHRSVPLWSSVFFGQA